MKIQITESELLTELRKSAPPIAPSDAMTAAELAKATGLGKTAIRKRLEELRREGRLLTWRVHRQDESGRVQSTPAYTIIPAKKAKR